MYCDWSVSVQISVSNAADGLFVDVGTQTHSFRSAPFKGKTTLAEVMVERPLKLHLQLQAESVNSRHNRASCVFTYVCGHTFHRREFATHFRCPADLLIPVTCHFQSLGTLISTYNIKVIKFDLSLKIQQLHITKRMQPFGNVNQ